MPSLKAAVFVVQALAVCTAYGQLRHNRDADAGNDLNSVQATREMGDTADSRNMEAIANMAAEGNAQPASYSFAESGAEMADGAYTTMSAHMDWSGMLGTATQIATMVGRELPHIKAVFNARDSVTLPESIDASGIERLQTDPMATQGLVKGLNHMDDESKEYVARQLKLAKSLRPSNLIHRLNRELEFLEYAGDTAEQCRIFICLSALDHDTCVKNEFFWSVKQTVAHNLAGRSAWVRELASRTTVRVILAALEKAILLGKGAVDAYKIAGTAIDFVASGVNVITNAIHRRHVRSLGYDEFVDEVDEFEEPAPELTITPSLVDALGSLQSQCSFVIAAGDYGAQAFREEANAHSRLIRNILTHISNRHFKSLWDALKQANAQFTERKFQDLVDRAMVAAGGRPRHATLLTPHEAMQQRAAARAAFERGQPLPAARQPSTLVRQDSGSFNPFSVAANTQAAAAAAAAAASAPQPRPLSYGAASGSQGYGAAAGSQGYGTTSGSGYSGATGTQQTFGAGAGMLSRPGSASQSQPYYPNQPLLPPPPPGKSRKLGGRTTDDLIDLSSK